MDALKARARLLVLENRGEKSHVDQYLPFETSSQPDERKEYGFGDSPPPPGPVSRSACHPDPNPTQPNDLQSHPHMYSDIIVRPVPYMFK